ncbi:MAG: hypothetical protein BGO55_24755 [Sphingobacteriales bacterium 50-39]|nr:MAG: hypothetical protein BGO55_24755 [Sphingobacteriales bacterium 50-39]
MVYGNPQAGETMAAQFRVPKEKRESTIENVTEAVSHWRGVAARMGIPKRERERMEVAFDF